MVGRRGLLGSLPEEDREHVLAAMHRRRFARGETLFLEGEPGDSLHLIESGRVIVQTMTADGGVTTLAIRVPGDAIGEQALLVDGVRGATVRAIEPVETRVLHRADFEALRRAHPAVERFLTAVLAAEVRRLDTLLLEAFHVPAEIRVLRRVLALVGPGAHPPVTVALTQEDLASMAGTTRPTANRVLRAAQDDGVLALARGRVQVLDVAALRERCG